MDKNELIQMVKHQIITDPHFKSEILTVIEDTNYSSTIEAIAAATNLLRTYGLEISEKETAQNYVFIIALKFAKLIQEKIGACYLKPRERWNSCIENNLIDLCKRTNRDDIKNIDAYIKRKFPNFEESIDVFEILENFRRQS